MSLNFRIEKLIGTKINLFYGQTMTFENISGRGSFQFSKDLTILDESKKLAISMNGVIKELQNHEDSFSFNCELLSESQINYFDLCTLQYRTKATKSFLEIREVQAYGIRIPTILDPNLIALHFLCKEQEEFLIHFSFPADGLSLTFEKEMIKNYFLNNSFGKRAFFIDVLK